MSNQEKSQPRPLTEGELAIARDRIVRAALEAGLENPFLEAAMANESTAIAIGELMVNPPSEGRHVSGGQRFDRANIEYQGNLGGGSPRNPLRIGGLTHQ